MSDFETRLRDGLRELDAAIPDAAPLVRPLTLRRWDRRRQVLVVLAAAAALVAATALATVATAPPPDPADAARTAALEERLRDDIAFHVGDRCLSHDEIVALVRERLAAMGLEGWAIREGGITRARCVAAAPVAEDRLVILLSSVGGDLSRALAGVRAELLEECFGRDQAIELVRTTAARFGMAEAQVMVVGVDELPMPADDDERYRRHVEEGCYVLGGGARIDPTGRHTFLVGGR